MSLVLCMKRKFDLGRTSFGIHWIASLDLNEFIETQLMIFCYFALCLHQLQPKNEQFIIIGKCLYLAPEPKVNLIFNGNFEDRNSLDPDADDDYLGSHLVHGDQKHPSEWTPVAGAKIGALFDSKLDLCYCRVEMARKTSALCQNVTSQVSFNHRSVLASLHIGRQVINSRVSNSRRLLLRS